MDDKIITRLKRVGFTEYEAKAYLLLLKLGQSSAREIADTSDIPRSRIYSVLKTLADKRFISIIEGTPMYYLPLDPDPIFTLIRDDYCEEINELKKSLRESYYEINTSSPYWAIYNDRGIEIMIQTLVFAAQKEIIVMVTNPQDLRPHLSLLRAARKRIELFVLVPDKSLFVGMGLRIIQMQEKLVNFFEDMYTNDASMHTCVESLKYDSHSDEYFHLIDGIKALSIGYQNKTRCATVIRIPTFCYLFRKMLSVYEPTLE
jgi:HTH-type transcriptional regulator, sugar sensing transcriptional regulator